MFARKVIVTKLNIALMTEVKDILVVPPRYYYYLLIATSSSKLSPGGLRQFTLSPVRDDDRTQELGLTLLGRVPMLALYTHTHH